MIPRWQTAHLIAIKCVVTIDFRSHRRHLLEMSNSVYLVSDSERFYVFYAPVLCVSPPQREFEQIKIGTRSRSGE